MDDGPGAATSHDAITSQSQAFVYWDPGNRTRDVFQCATASCQTFLNNGNISNEVNRNVQYLKILYCT